MPANIVRFIDLVLVALLAGTMFGIWIGFSPSRLSAATYVEQQQHTIRALNTPMPVLGAVCIVLTTLLAVVAKDSPAERYLLVAAALCLIAAGAITRFINQPINSELLTWSIQAPPANWAELRDRWWYSHVVRTLAGVAALAMVALALAPRGANRA